MDTRIDNQRSYLCNDDKCVKISRSPSPELLKCLKYAAYSSFALALTTFFFHAIGSNPQYDTQVIRYAMELINSVREGTLIDYLMAERKYPIFYTIPYAFVIQTIKVVLGIEQYEIIQIHFIARLVTVIYSVGILLILHRLSRMLVGESTAVLLLLSSILFFIFATAVRVHIPVTFWTLLSFYFSVQMYRRQTMCNVLGSYIVAAIAFGTLHNGIFAFIFPLWAHIGGQWNIKHVTKVTMVISVCIAVSFLLGYSFVIREIFEDSGQGSLAVGHNLGVQFTGMGFKTILKTLFGSEIFITIFAILGGVKLLKYKRKYQEFIPIVVFLGLYFLVFGFSSITYSRFYIITLPFLALIGALALKDHKWLHCIMFLVVIIMQGKLMYLGLQPNTYQAASAFVERNEGYVATDIPNYFLEIPRDRYLAKDITDVSYILSLRDKFQPNNDWIECAQFSSSRSNANMFLWVSVPWANYRLFEASSLGPNITAFCKKNDLITKK